MGSEVVVEARVCDNDGDSRRHSDVALGFIGDKLDDVSSFGGSKGTCSASGSMLWTKKHDTKSYRSSYVVSRSIAEDGSRGLDHGITSGSIAIASKSDGQQIQQRVGKVPRTGGGSFNKLRKLEADHASPQAENDDANMELDMLGSNLVKCSNAAEKSQAMKQRNNINGRRGDKRNGKALMKAKFDPFSLKAGLPSFSLAAGGSSTFGMYGLKPDVHDVTKLMDDISLDELFDGTYKCPMFGKGKGNRTSNANVNILDSVRKVCSLIRPQGTQQGKPTEDVDIHAIRETHSLSSPPSNSVENASDVDGTAASLLECNKDLDSCVKGEALVDLSDSPLYHPREVLQRLALPPPKDLESLLQDAVKPALSMKLTDSRSSKQLSHRVSLPPFPWSHNFNGHHKSNNDAQKNSNKTTCFGRWVRISSTASFVGGSGQGSVELDSLKYDDSLVPAGHIKYVLPEVGKKSITSICEQASLSASLPPLVSNSPKVLAAAQTLCDMASYSSKHRSDETLKWAKQPFQKAMKARKSRLSEIPEEEVLEPRSPTVVLHGSSSKKPKTSRREDYSHVQAVIGLSSLSGPRSNRPSPSRLSRDSLSEGRHVSGSFAKSTFLVPPHPRVLDQSNQNPHKKRKSTPMDWNRTRS